MNYISTSASTRAQLVKSLPIFGTFWHAQPIYYYPLFALAATHVFLAGSDGRAGCGSFN